MPILHCSLMEARSRPNSPGGSDSNRWVALLAPLSGQTLRTIQGQPVIFTGIGFEGVVFTTGSGRQMTPVPLDQLDRAIEQYLQGFDISQPWRLRVFAKVDLDSYVWALLHHAPFRSLLDANRQSATATAARMPPIAISHDRESYELRSPHGPADPRPALIGALWNDELGLWFLPRTPANLRAARAAMSDSIPGGAPARPYVVQSHGDFHLFAAFSDREHARSVPSGRWVSTERCWRYPATDAVLQQLTAAFGERLVLAADLTVATEVPPPQALLPVEHLQPTRPAVLSVPPGVEVAREGAAPWTATTERPPTIEWLEGHLEALTFADLDDLSSTPEWIASVVARGAFDRLERIPNSRAPDDPLQAAVWLTAHLCAVLRARSPLQLIDADVETLRAVAPVPPSTLDLALEAAASLPPAAATSVYFVIIACQGMRDARRTAVALDGFHGGSSLADRGCYLAAWSSLASRTLDGLGADAAAAVGRSCTPRELADLVTEAWAGDATTMLRELMTISFPLLLARGGVLDLHTEVRDALEVAEAAGLAGLPSIANRVAELLEDGTLAAAGSFPAADVFSLYTFAHQVALRYHAPSDLAQAWHRLLRWHTGRGEHHAAIELARDVAFRPGLRVAAETSMAYSLADQGESRAAVEGLVAAYSRIRVSAPSDARQLLMEATALVGDNSSLADLLPPAPASDEPSAKASAWPKGQCALIVGGHDALRRRGIEVLLRAGVTAEWLTSEEAGNADSLRARIRGSATLVVLLTVHISHAIASRVDEATREPGLDVIFYDRYGPAGLPDRLRAWLEGDLGRYRPKGA